MALSKSLKTISGMKPIQDQSLQPKLSQWKVMSESHEETCTDWTCYNFWFKDFFSENPMQPATENNHLLSYVDKP